MTSTQTLSAPAGGAACIDDIEDAGVLSLLERFNSPIAWEDDEDEDEEILDDDEDLDLGDEEDEDFFEDDEDLDEEEEEELDDE